MITIRNAMFAIEMQTEKFKITANIAITEKSGNKSIERIENGYVSLLNSETDCIASFTIYNHQLSVHNITRGYNRIEVLKAIESLEKQANLLDFLK